MAASRRKPPERDAVRAWALLRLDREYRAAWSEHAAAPAYEDDTPFPVRIRSPRDSAAQRDWSLLAWEDPDGPSISAFFDVPMLDGTGSAQAPPLLALLEDAGARIEGLRTGDGALVVKVEKDAMAVQVRVTDDGPLMAGGGVRLFHDWGLGLAVAVARLTDLWSISGGPSPFEGPWPGVGGRARRTGAGSGSC